MVEAYWSIGESIIVEQGGNEEADYGTGLLKELSKQMAQDSGKEFTVANLKNMRQFYLTFPSSHALRNELSWAHYRLLIRVKSGNAREFHMQEAVKSQWSTRQLERQISSFFYERLLSSKDKEQVAAEIQTLESAKTPEDIARDPYVLELLGLNPNGDFYESDLEQVLITRLREFLLELGRGFSFITRQKRVTFDGRHFRIDLVFYNYILKRFVLMDLEVGGLTHQGLGQMQVYVHYCKRELMNEGDNPLIGIVLYADKSGSVVKYALPESETQIFASKYKLYLPSGGELLRELNQGFEALETGSLRKDIGDVNEVQVLHQDDTELIAENKVTYEEIKEYVVKQAGLEISNLYIVQTKQKCGIIEKISYNLPKSKNSIQPKCPLEKGIRGVLEYYHIIWYDGFYGNY